MLNVYDGKTSVPRNLAQLGIAMSIRALSMLVTSGVLLFGATKIAVVIRAERYYLCEESNKPLELVGQTKLM